VGEVLDQHLPGDRIGSGVAGAAGAALVVEEQVPSFREAKELWQEVVMMRPGSPVEDEQAVGSAGAVLAPVERDARRCRSTARSGLRHESGLSGLAG